MLAFKTFDQGIGGQSAGLICWAVPHWLLKQHLVQQLQLARYFPPPHCQGGFSQRGCNCVSIVLQSVPSQAMQLTRSIASYMKDAGKGCCLVEGPHLTIWGAAQEATPHCIKQRATRMFLLSSSPASLSWSVKPNSMNVSDDKQGPALPRLDLRTNSRSFYPRTSAFEGTSEICGLLTIT